MVRASKPRTNAVSAMSSALAVLAITAASPAVAAKFECPTRSPEFVFAQDAQPPGLDMHFSSAISTRNIAMQIFETLLTRDEKNDVIPQLAASHEISPDGLTYTFKLRSGVKFHNGQPMTSADVLASLERYKRIGIDRVTLNPVTSMTAPDGETLVLKLSQPTPTFLEDFSSFRVPIVIMPASEKDKEGNKAELIGTGPYRLVEWRPDSHVALARFADYQPDDRFDAGTGFGGRRLACFDKVTIRIVKEASARVAGLETGEYHGVEEITTKAAERLKNDKAITLLRQENFTIPIAIPNLQRPPTDRLPIRKAIQAALDLEQIMDAATDGAFSLQPGFQFPGNPSYTDAGKQYFNLRNADLAKKYMKEGNYKGEELIVMTNTDYPWMYNAALVMNEQLKAVGFKTRLEVTDWPTTRTIQQKDLDKWNFYFTGFGTGPSIGPRAAISDLVPPVNLQKLPKEDPELMQHWRDMVNLPTHEARLAAFAKMQEHLYAQAYQFKFGDMHRYQAVRSNVKGFVPYRIPRMWNVWLQG